MDILENKAGWLKTYQTGWLAHQQATGEIDWKLYQHPRNQHTPGVPGIDLRRSRLLLISSAGAYLPDQQPPFDAASPTGDYTVRTLPVATSLADLAFAHDHYDHTMIDQDAQVAIPLEHLQGLVEQKEIASLASVWVSFMGYQPNSAQAVDEVIPSILEVARRENVDAALLAPV